jgi:MoxR-like ATPase
VTPDDVKELVQPALRHRIVLRPDAEIEGLTPDDVLGRVLAGVEVPR